MPFCVDCPGAGVVWGRSRSPLVLVSVDWPRPADPRLAGHREVRPLFSMHGRMTTAVRLDSQEMWMILDCFSTTHQRAWRGTGGVGSGDAGGLLGVRDVGDGAVLVAPRIDGGAKLRRIDIIVLP